MVTKNTKKDPSSLKGKDKKFFEALMEARTRLGENFAFHTNEALKFEKNSSAERSGMSTHMADHGSDNFRHDMELGMLTNEGEALELIEEALERLLEGEYGECQDCGCDIPVERLEAKPYARFCVKCKGIREQNGEIDLV